MCEEKKICTKCKIEKPISLFYKSSNSKSGYKSNCKECHNEWAKNNKDKVKLIRDKYNDLHKEHVIEYRKEWAIKNPDKKLESNRKYAEVHKDEIKERKKENADIIRQQNRKFYYSHREERLSSQKEYVERNKEKIKQRKRDYYQKNKEHGSAKNKEWKLKNINKHRKYCREYARKQRSTNPIFRLKEIVRARVKIAIKSKTDAIMPRTKDLICCDIEILKLHLESQFSEGMSWDNLGEWHIDHIIPLAAASDEDEIIKLCHYTNLQPLWAIDNLKKGDKYEEKDKIDFLSSLNTKND